MTDFQDSTESSTEDAWRGARLSRRAFARRAIGLGLSLPAIGSLLAACSSGQQAAPAGPTATTAAPVQSTGKTYKVSIMNKEMTRNEVVEAIKKEGEVNVAN